MGASWTQTRPPAPAFTEKNLPRQDGKVFIVTGGTAGVGYQLCKILYSKGGKVYMAARSSSKASTAISQIQSAHPSENPSKLTFLSLQLDDLSGIKATAEAFKLHEKKLDVLWNNAGVSQPPVGTKSAQGHEQHMGVNCLAPLLLTNLLLPELRAAAKESSSGEGKVASGRVIWTSSLLVDSKSPEGGLVMSELTSPTTDQVRNYAASKAGNWFLASEIARHEKANGSNVISITQNPGNLKTDLWNTAGKLIRMLVSSILYDPIYGAYTELWAGLAPEVTVKDSGRYVIPWGRWHPDPRADLVLALKAKEEGGSGRAGEFYDWCMGNVREFM